MRIKYTLVAILTVLAGLWALPAYAEWSTNPTENTPICTAAVTQEYAELVSDGMGGAIIAWTDSRSGISDIYAQRMDSVGDALWPVDGVIVCDEIAVQELPQLVSDGAGGAFIVWRDWRTLTGTPDIYAQRIDGSGNILMEQGEHLSPGRIVVREIRISMPNA